MRVPHSFRLKLQRSTFDASFMVVDSPRNVQIVGSLGGVLMGVLRMESLETAEKHFLCLVYSFTDSSLYLHHLFGFLLNRKKRKTIKNELFKSKPFVSLSSEMQFSVNTMVWCRSLSE